MLRQRKKMSRHSALLLEGFIVATENNYQGRTCVATEFFYVMIEGVGCRSFLYCDIRFYVVTGNGHSKGSVVVTELARQGLRCATTYGFMCDRAWSCEEVPMSRPDILGRN